MPVCLREGAIGTLCVSVLQSSSRLTYHRLRGCEPGFTTQRERKASSLADPAKKKKNKIRKSGNARQ